MRRNSFVGNPKSLLKFDRDRSTVILGDFNSIAEQEVNEVRIAKEKFIQKNPEFRQRSDYEGYFVPVFDSLIQPKVIPWLINQGFHESNDFLNQPTAMTKLHPAKLPLIFRIDHIFCSKGLQIKKFQIFTNPFFHQASDHLPIMIEI